MKKIKTRYIWSSDHDIAYPNKEEVIEEYRDFLEANNMPIPDEISDEDLYNYIDDCISEDFSILMSEIRHYERTHGEKEYVIVADLGLWDGRQAGVGVAQNQQGIRLDLAHQFIGAVDDVAHGGAQIVTHRIHIDIRVGQA